MSATVGNTGELRVIAARRSNRQQLREIWQYRELLLGLIRKELKVRYKNSVLGFFWSMAQPVFLLCIYSLVFSILDAGFEDFWRAIEPLITAPPAAPPADAER